MGRINSAAELPYFLNLGYTSANPGQLFSYNQDLWPGAKCLKMGSLRSYKLTELYKFYD